MKLHRLVPLAAAVFLAACHGESVTAPSIDQPASASADEVTPPPPPDSTGRGGHNSGSGN